MKSTTPPLVFMCVVIMLVLVAVPTYVWLCYKANKACVSEGGVALQAYKSVPEWCVMPDGRLVPIGRRPE